MTKIRTVYAVIPAAAAIEPALAAFKALPLGDPAKLIGLHVSPFAVTYGLVGDIALAGLIEAQIEAAEREKASAEEAFTKACDRAGISSEWRAEKALDYLISPHAGAMARAADLVVSPKLPEGSSIGDHVLEELVFASGRPVLGIPTGWSGNALGQNILIAWDGGREAARAVFDAMPLLLQAKSVRIVSVQGFMDEPVRQFTAADDLATTLSRHGIRAESHTFGSTRQSVKEELKVQLRETGADMVVMGCYGHSRFREMILGGVSRDVLAEMPFPLLLAS